MRDEFLGRMGALTLRFVVPPAAGWRLSTPFLTNRVSLSKDGPARPIAVARREFFTSETLYCQFEVFGVAGHNGAGPTVRASYELRGRNGDVLRRSEPSPVSPSTDGHLVRLVAMTLDGIPEGHHELVVRVEDLATGETRERIEPLRITRPADLLGLPAAAPAEALSPAFLKAVERYRRADRDVVREKWSVERLRKDIADLRRLQHRSSTCVDCEERRHLESFPFEAAVMLYTDRDVEERNSHPALEEVPSLPAPLLDAARQMLELIPDPERRRRFERSWLLAVVLHLYQRGQWPMALRYLDLGLERYPEDPRFLLARGSILEAQGAQDLERVSTAEGAATTQSGREAAWRQVAASRGQMEQAENCYRRALTADPGLLEARVRLGHVLHRLGQTEKAVRELEGVIAARDVDAHVRYLAWLFLGAIREAAGRPRDAVTAYQAAISLLPDSQAAYIALSHAFHRLGELAASRESLRETIVRAGRRRDWDPWLVYPWGQSHEAEGRLDALRQQAVR
jgi:tetratricopeptide (TPR) repeat protein